MMAHPDKTRSERAGDAESASALFLNLPALIQALDADGSIVMWNRECERVTGYSASEIVGNPRAMGLLFPDAAHRERALEHWRRPPGEDGPWECEVTCKDGSKRVISWSPAAHRIPVAGWAAWALGADITDRRGAIERMRLFEAIVESSHEAISARDPSGRLVYVNPAHVRLFGRRAEDVVGEDHRLAYPPESVEYLNREVIPRVSQGESWEGDIEAWDAAGNRFVLWQRVDSMRDEDGSVLYAFGLMHDVTTERNAERELALSEHRYRELVERMSSGVAVYRAIEDGGDFVFVEFNRACERIEGLPRERVVGRRVTTVFPQVRDIGLLDALRRVWRTGIPAQLPVMYYDDGRIAGWRKNYVYRLPSGEVVSVYDDVTETRRAEQALEKREATLDSVIRAAPVGIALMVDRAIWEANPRFCEMLGYAPEELVGRDTRMLYLSQEPYERVGREMYRQIASDGIGTVETQWVRKDGSVIDVWLSSAASDSANTSAGVTVTVLDITDRKASESAVRRSEILFRTMAENIPGVIYLCRNAPAWTAIFLNSRIEDLTGYPKEDFLEGRLQYPDLVHPEDRERVRQAVHAAFDQRIPFRAMYRIRHRGGGTRWVEESGIGIFNEKGLDLFEGYVVDVSERVRAEEERKKLEEQFQQTQKLESLGVLAGGIAHDFNNLLMTILGNADLALQGVLPGDASHDCLREIIQTSQRAADLCRQLLAYSGKGKLRVETVGINEIVSEMAHLLEVSISKKALLKLNLAANLPPVCVDATQLRQVVMNLITNASDSIGEQTGFVTLRTGATDCTVRELEQSYLHDKLPAGLYVFVEVSDTGCGMTPETIRRIFDPFFTTKFTGRGLGLAAVLGIVRGHHGAIRVESTPGKGTAFTILLPAAESEAALKPASPPKTTVWQSSGAVLLVDDEPTILALGKRMLERLGFEVLTATNGQEALASFRSRRAEIRCVILDLTMPHMDGEEALAELRTLDADVPVIMSSGYNEYELEERLRDVGVQGFLQKPYQIPVLIEALRAALGE